MVGDDSLKDPPVPIPNTEVKLQDADGTAGATLWESRSSPTNPLPPPLSTTAPGAAFFRSGAAHLRPRTARVDLDGSGTLQAPPDPAGPFMALGSPARAATR